MAVVIIRGISLLIMAAAATTSYVTQRDLFLSWQAGDFTSAVAPISVDLLAVLCTFALHTRGYSTGARVVASVVLLLTAGGSVAANWIAGESLGAKAVHAGMVLLYLLAEWVASQRPQLVAKVADISPAKAPRKAPTGKTPAAKKATAKAPRQRGRYGPRNGEAYSPRQLERIAKEDAAATATAS